MDAASQIVADEGLEALTLARLAGELGYVPAALYRYFDSKDALLAELQRRTIKSLHREFGAARERARAQADQLGLDDRARALFELLIAMRFYLALPTRAPADFRLLSLLLADPRPIVADHEARVTAPAVMAFLNDVRELLSSAAERGALSQADAFDRTLVLWSSLQGTAQLGKLTRFDARRFDPQRLGQLTAESLLIGWGATSADIARAARALDTLDRDPEARPNRRKKP